MRVQSEIELEAEVNYLHKSMFGGLASEKVISHYISANKSCSDLHAGSSEIELINKIIKKSLNVIAFESALRRNTNRHLLTRKMILLAYIAECDGEHHQSYNLSIPPYVFWIILPFWAGRTLFRLMLGKILVARHGF